MVVCCVFPVISEQVYSPNWGYSLDLPEGFSLSSNQDNTRYQFDHTMLPISLMIAAYPQERYQKASDALGGVYKSLELQGEMDSVLWRGEETSVGVFTMNPAGTEYSGWAVSILLPENTGTAVFLSYAPTAQFSENELIIVSMLDTIDIVRGTAVESGILTKYAYPSEGDKSVALEIDGLKITSTIDAVDIEASEFVVQREYAILTYFANTPLWKESWQRFYRVIYRDSHKRLQRVAFSIYNSLSPKIKEVNPDSFDKALTQSLLTWVQGFEYLRIPLGTDFVPLPAVISGSGSDCDSRALLLSVLMNHMRYKTMLFVSRDYGHAFFGIAIEGEGARLESEGVSYLLGETTAPVALGLVPQDMSEISKWIAIDGL